jgi:ribonucleoside-diphosphate reductase alpha chain
MLNRYLMKDEKQNPLETPQFFWMRVAMGMSLNEKDPNEWAIKFYDKMSALEYLSAGSTNIGAGTPKPKLSNCFLMEMHDDMEHIGKTVSDVLLLSKATGGIGLSVTKLRAEGSLLKSNNTVSSGPVPFMHIIDSAVRAVQRGGKKKGALCFYMENWHLNFQDFLDLKQNNGDDYRRARTANTAVYISDEFMTRVINGDDWYLFDPKEVMDLNAIMNTSRWPKVAR